jgi:hypothetical protein
MMLPNPDEFLRALGREIASLRGVNNLPPEIKERLYASLIPLDLLYTYEVDPTTLLNREGHRAFQFDFPPDQGMERKGLHLPRRHLPESSPLTGDIGSNPSVTVGDRSPGTGRSLRRKLGAAHLSDEHWSR